MYPKSPGNLMPGLFGFLVAMEILLHTHIYKLFIMA